MRTLYLLFLLLLCPVSGLKSDELFPPLRVGMELGYPPFEMICPKGQPCGISVDLAKALGESLHREVEIENISFVGLIPALNTGKVDLVLSSLTVTEQRKRVVDFSIPYATTGLCLLIHASSSLQDISQANDPSRVIVVKSGTSGEVYAAQRLNQATIRVLDKEAACVLEVIQGKADAFIYDQLAVYTHWKKNPFTTRAALEPFQKEQWAIAIKKDHELFLNQINLFLEKYRADGNFERLADKYLFEQKRAFKEMGIPFIL